jgi:hypothetical protein
MNEPSRNDAVLHGTVLALAAALREVIASFPEASPVRHRLQAARDTQERAMRELGHSESVLFALERAWLSLLEAEPTE